MISDNGIGLTVNTIPYMDVYMCVCVYIYIQSCWAKIIVVCWSSFPANSWLQVNDHYAGSLHHIPSRKWSCPLVVTKLKWRNHDAEMCTTYNWTCTCKVNSLSCCCCCVVAGIAVVVIVVVLHYSFEADLFAWYVGSRHAHYDHHDASIPIPIGSMYGIYANIWGILMVNVSKYTIHGSYGILFYINVDQIWLFPWCPAALAIISRSKRCFFLPHALVRCWLWVLVPP